MILEHGHGVLGSERARPPHKVLEGFVVAGHRMGLCLCQVREPSISQIYSWEVSLGYG